MKRILVNLYKDIVLSVPSTHFLYNVVYKQHIKIVIQINAIRSIYGLYPYSFTPFNKRINISKEQPNILDFN